MEQLETLFCLCFQYYYYLSGIWTKTGWSNFKNIWAVFFRYIADRWCMASPICYVYLYRSGAEEGWEPESVKIYGYNSEPITFDFNTSIPNGTWYGYNLCETPSSSYQLSPQKWFMSLVLGSVLSFWL